MKQGRFISELDFSEAARGSSTSPDSDLVKPDILRVIGQPPIPFKSVMNEGDWGVKPDG